jgi:hypothetical protein
MKIRADGENIRLKEALVNEDKAQNDLRALKSEISNAEDGLMSLAPKVQNLFFRASVKV